jgi:hypothetical protein
MSTAALLRELWRLRRAVAVFAFAAIAIALLLMFRISFPPSLQSRHHEIGVASTSALIDTPSSQVVDLGGRDSAVAPLLPGRAALLASLLATSPLKDEIARRAGIPSRTLIAVGAPASSGTGTAAPLTTGNTIHPDDPRASIVTFQTDTTLPLLTVNVQAPDIALATRLANGTVQTLQAHLATVAAAQGIPEGRRVVVKQLGPARFGTATRGPSRLIALVAASFLFVLACGALLFVAHLSREWYRSEELERLALTWDEQLDPEASPPATR